MSSMCIPVEFLAGTTISTAIREAKEKAITFKVAYITFSFNGVQISVSQHAYVYDIEEQWNEILASGKSFWCVSSFGTV